QSSELNVLTQGALFGVVWHLLLQLILFRLLRFGEKYIMEGRKDEFVLVL
ncbi:Uncharacterized protein DAT39_007543, partial [Clarias magur]